MRIGIVAPAHNPLPSPPGRIWAPGVIISSLASGLASQGHDIFLFTTRDSKIEKRKNLTIIDSNCYSIFHDYPSLRINNFAKFTELFAMYDLVVISNAIKFVNDNRIDVIHFHDIRRALFLSDTINIPTLFTYHTIIDEYYNHWLKIASDKYNGSINISAFTNQHGQQYKNYFNNIYIVPNGIEINRFKFSKYQGNNFLFAGRIIKQKGVETAIQVACDANINLDIIGHEGDGKQDKNYFDDIIHKVRNMENVHYLGYFPYNEMPDHYSKAKALLVPIEIEEPFGLTIVEAMACGTPVVAYNSGSVKELIIDNETGYICPPGDTKAMENAIRRINQLSIDEYQNMRLACRKHVEKNFTVEKMVEGYENTYNKIIKEY